VGALARLRPTDGRIPRPRGAAIPIYLERNPFARLPALPVDDAEARADEAAESGTVSYRKVHRDANHWPIVRALEALGLSVLDLSAAGKGCPDLAVCGTRGGVRGTSEQVLVWFVEIKSETSFRHGYGVQANQQAWMDRWPGPSTVLWSVDDAIAWALGQPRPPGPVRVRKRKADAATVTP
jgi:hypothetical protein